MAGIIFAAAAALTRGIEKILHRYILVDEDSLSYAFIWNLLTSFFLIPLFIAEFALPQENFAWLLVIASSLIWAATGYVGFKAYSYLEVSLKEPISKSKLLFVLILSVVFLKESLTLAKISGTLLIFVGIVLLTYKKRKRFGDLNNKGVQLTLLSAFLVSIVLIIDKVAINFFNPGMYAFLVYFLPAMVFFPFVLGRKTEMKSIIRNRFGATTAATLLGAVSYYLILSAFKVAEASLVVPILELSILVSVFGGIKFLKEKEAIPKKIIAAVLAIVGAILVSGVF